MIGEHIGDLKSDYSPIKGYLIMRRGNLVRKLNVFDNLLHFDTRKLFNLQGNLREAN